MSNVVVSVVLIAVVLVLGYVRIVIARRSRRNQDPLQTAETQARERRHPVLWAIGFTLLGAALGALEAFRSHHGQPSVTRVVILVAVFTVAGAVAGGLQIRHARSGVMSERELLPRLDAEDSHRRTRAR